MTMRYCIDGPFFERVELYSVFYFRLISFRKALVRHIYYIYAVKEACGEQYDNNLFCQG